MKKKLLVAASAALLVLFSCEDEGTVVNNEVILPDPVTENVILETTSLFENKVLIDWEFLKGLEGEGIVYDVTVNGQKLGDKISPSSISLDGDSFRSGSEKEIVLDISITAFNTVGEAQNALVTYETTKVVELNNAPKEFTIQSVTTEQNGLLIQFTDPVDTDDDQLAFDFFIDEDLVGEEVAFRKISTVTETIVLDQFGRPITTGTNSNLITRVNPLINQFFAEYDFSDKLSQDIVVKIVAKDENGGKNEAETSFNIKGSDKDLGVLAGATKTDIVIDLSKEVDDEVSYFFTLEKTTGLRFVNTNGSQVFNSISVRAIEGVNTNSFFSIDRNGEFLEEGKYEIVFGFNNNFLGEEITLETYEEDSQNKDLGLLSLPFETTDEIELFKEVDENFVYTFQVDQEADYIFSVDNSINLEWILMNTDTQTVINSDFFDDQIDSRFNSRLTPGNYELSITRRNSSTDVFDLNLVVEAVNVTTVSPVGAVSLPFSKVYDIDAQVDLFQNRIVQIFEFEVPQRASYLFSTDVSANFTIKDEFGNSVRSNSFTRFFRSFGTDLQRGKYTLEVSDTGNGLPTKLNFNLSDSFSINTQANTDLGQVAIPFSTEVEFDFTSLLIDTLVYTFEITEDASYSIGTGLQETDITLTRLSSPTSSFSRFIRSGSRGIIDANEDALTPGVYRIEVENRTSNPAKGKLSIRLE